MARYITTGCYSAAALKGMMAHPSDREAQIKPLISAAGGKVLSFHLTMGETDFSLMVETDDAAKMMAALMVTGASGAVTNLKTVQAFTTGEFMTAQKAASGLVASYAVPA
jgi:uncharacterized protein with GYD domain